MLTEREVLSTINMLRSEHLDVRTVTLGINLFDCASHDFDVFELKVRSKILKYAKRLVETCNGVGDRYGIPVVNKRIAVSAVTDSRTGDLIVKLVNLLPVEVRSSIALRGFGAFRPTAARTVLTGRPDDRRAHPATSTLETDGTEFPCLLPAYSFTVLRLSPQ